MTGYGDIIAVNDVEAGEHRLVVGDTLGIATFYKADDGLGQDHRKLLNNLIVTDDVDDGRGGDESDAVEGLLGEEDVCHLDYTLVAETFGIKIVADGDGCLEILDPEDTDSFEKH